MSDPTAGDLPILVVGAGAVGGYIAAHLARAGEPIVVLEPWEPNRAAIRTAGMTVEEPAGRFTVPLRTIAVPAEVGALAPRLVMLCTKLADAPAAVAALEAHYHGPYLVTLNALADLTMAEALGAERVMGCIVTGLFANLVRPGEMQRHRARHDGGPATFRLGEVSGPPTPRLTALTTLLGQVDRAESVDDLAAARWTKLVFNSMTSALSALHQRPIRDLFLDPALRADMTALALEVVTVADAAGVSLDPVCGIPGATWVAATGREPGAAAALEAGLIRYGEKMNPTALSGMAQDRRRGRRTEASLINGAVVEQARRRGIDAPANAALIAQVDTPPTTG
ncbi:MAG TPA: ketopantoate reductase C-terminal domain-containing protein [Roseomonas sp.]|jgi:2-dehydropantoate 2-reductase